MTIVDSAIRNITCDAEGCTKAVLYDRKDEKTVFDNPDNAWLKTTRVIQTADGRNFTYCSDLCEVNGTGSGKHNIPEPKKIVETTNPAAIAMAAQAAAQARQADQTLREGSGGKIQVATS